jgi:hypothetical protein
MIPENLFQKEQPEGLRPFDYDTDLPLVTAFVAKHEDGMYDFSNMLGSGIGKAIGARMDFDVVRCQSLKNPEQVSFYLCLAVNVGGQSLGTHDHRTIAGVADGHLWFRRNNHFVSAESELKIREILSKGVAEKISGPLKQIFKDLEQAIEDLHDGEGEEWKRDQN